MNTIEPKQYLPSCTAVSLGRLGLLMAVFLAFAPCYHSMAQAFPQQPQPVPVARVNERAVLSAKERKARDEVAIRGEVLRLEAREQNATHVGMEQGSRVVDPKPDKMRTLLADRPALQPASALAQPGASGRFTLVTVSDVEWHGKNRGRVSGICRSGIMERGFSSHNYVVTRGKVSRANPTGWVLKHGALGCGFWDRFTLLHDGRATVIKHIRR